MHAKWHGKSIADVLEMSIAEAAHLFESAPQIARILGTLVDVGLGYLTLGQPAPQLSGGEAQRVKLSRELAKPGTGSTLYILDEPTTGLHFSDIEKLLHVLERLVEAGNTVLVVEHNLEVIAAADWVIDMGPEAGDGGGQIVAEGPPEDIFIHAERWAKQKPEKHRRKSGWPARRLHCYEAIRVRPCKVSSNRRLYKTAYQRASTPVFTPCKSTLPDVLMPLLATFPVPGSTVATES